MSMNAQEFIEQARINNMPEKDIQKFVREYEKDMQRFINGEGPEPFDLSLFLSVVND